MVWVESVNANTETAEILTAECEDGDWYPEFNSNKYSYTITVPAETTEKNLIYTVGKDATVTLKNVEQKPDSEGKYTLPLTTAAQTLTITSADGSMVNSYSFKMLKRKSGCRIKSSTTCASAVSTQTVRVGEDLEFLRKVPLQEH